MLYFIIGENGVGKTDFSMNILRDYCTRKKGLIITAHNMEPMYYSIPLVPIKKNQKGEIINIDFNYRGLKRIVLDRKNQAQQLSYILNKYSNGALLLDDYKAFVLTQRDEDMRTFVGISRKQNNIDIFLTAHGLNEILPSLYTFKPSIILFATSTAIPRSIMQKLNPDKAELLRKRKEFIDKTGEKKPHYCEVIKISVTPD